MLFGIIRIPGAGLRDNVGNNGCLLMVPEACRCGHHIKEFIPEDCRISCRL